MPVTVDSLAGHFPKVLITGATGFIGSAISTHFSSLGIRIVPTGRSAESGRDWQNYRVLDILRPDTLPSALHGADTVIHAAGLAHQFGPSGEQAAFMAVNAEGTRNVVCAAAQVGVRHVILLSSVSVYGPHSDAVVDENVPCHPKGSYAESKLESEQCALAIARESNIRLTILRLATVYGEGDRGNIARLMRSIDKRRFVWIGTGTNRKSLIHCHDVARACLAALQPCTSNHGVYNVSAPACSMQQVVETLCTALGRHAPSWHVPSWAVLRLAGVVNDLTGRSARGERTLNMIEKWLANDVYDGSRFEQAYAFHTVVNLAGGLRREVAWYRAQATRVVRKAV